MKEISITEFDGIKIGNVENPDAMTGCTVIICENGATAGVDIRGGAPGTRETALLNPINMIQQVQAIFLSGGSAYGLDAASGIMEYLEERNIGFDVGVSKVPIVSGAVLFDLEIGDYKVRPDKKMGYTACINAEKGIFEEGNYGAGCGATIGKILGTKYAMKGGLGAYAIQIGDLKVGAVVAVNCLGDVIDPISNKILAGAFSREKKNFISTEEFMIKNYNHKSNVFNGNTTIGAVITNAALTKTEMNKVASMAHNGFGRVIRPSHTMYDGDTIFALSSGEVVADINVVGLLAANVIEQAVINGIKKAVSFDSYISYAEVNSLFK
ncbi:MAG: peptidase DmpA [Clostridiales bacterium]|nr:peptidase DmpA [Clostridiales bacterium]